MRFALALGLATGLTVLAGCSKQADGRVTVSGNVRLKGKPIKDGAMVLFEPIDGQDTAANATTVNGAFLIPQHTGLKPGKYLIRVTAGDGVTAVNPLDSGTGPGAEGPAPGGPGRGTNIVSKDLVPKEWNVASKQQVTVTADGPNKFDFEIP
jgi:hypothetical protein